MPAFRRTIAQRASGFILSTMELERRLPTSVRVPLGVPRSRMTPLYARQDVTNVGHTRTCTAALPTTTTPPPLTYFRVLRVRCHWVLLHAALRWFVLRLFGGWRRHERAVT